MALATLFKNVFVKTGDAPNIEALTSLALIQLVLSLVIQKWSVTNLLTGLGNFLKAPANKPYMMIFHTLFAESFIDSTYAVIISPLDNYELARSDGPSGFSVILAWLFVLGVIQISLKFLILVLSILGALWA